MSRSIVQPGLEHHALHRVETFDRVLATGCLVLLIAVLAAIGRGYGRWSEATPMIWVHLLLVVGALGLGIVQLWRRKGGKLHRLLGRLWVSLMFSTAVASLFIVEGERWQFSPIHVLSVVVIVQAPVIAWTGHTGRLDHHRGAVRANVLGALILAGFFTFPFDRLLGTWLFGP